MIQLKIEKQSLKVEEDQEVKGFRRAGSEITV